MSFTVSIEKKEEMIPLEWKELFHLSLQKVEDIVEKVQQDPVIYPAPENIFKAFDSCPPDGVKVVIVGQDCYHRKGQATGLAFAVPADSKIPPSLRNIQKELKDDLGVEFSDQTLQQWSDQGVLLLNSALTVREGEPGSHLEQWEPFTDDVIKILSQTRKRLVFLFWGKYAQAKQPLIDPKGRHLVLTASHPSPLAANRGGWFGRKHFSRTNAFLRKNRKRPIEW